MTEECKAKERVAFMALRESLRRSILPVEAWLARASLAAETEAENVRLRESVRQAIALLSTDDGWDKAMEILFALIGSSYNMPRGKAISLQELAALPEAPFEVALAPKGATNEPQF